VNEAGVKLTTYFGERERAGDVFLADALQELYERHEIHTSVLLRGVDGFGASHHVHSDRQLTTSENLPAMSIAIDTAQRIGDTVGDVLALAGDGLISLERARLIAGEGLRDPGLPPDPQTPVKLTLYGGRSMRAGNQAGYVRAVQCLSEAGAAGASVLLGVDGTLHGERRRARFFARNAAVPLMVLALGSRASLERALPELTQLLDDPVMTLERVQIVKTAGRRLADPVRVPERDPSGLASWCKLTVHVEEHARHGGRPVHIELVRRLREAGAAGATVLRGVRGFYAGRDPVHDRLWSLRRTVPVSVIAIDSPAAMRAWWPVIDEVTAEHGLVTSELVPASHGLGVSALSLGDAPGPPRSR
jgi:PII-like signaling protein